MGRKFIGPIICLVLVFITSSVWAFDEQDDSISDYVHGEESGQSNSLPKDKILLKTINKLTFYRNKRTTSRRTHSIHQLSCVGGTAGCKLFTPNVVECDNTGFDKDRRKFNWRCQADISDRVEFNHVEVICEGYDYPEDDYILLGSCGLEFTLDYRDPHDYHHNSYFKHMDDHEKELHHNRVKENKKHKFLAIQAGSYWATLQQLIIKITNHIFLISILLVVALTSYVLLRLYTRGNRIDNSKTK